MYLTFGDLFSLHGKPIKVISPMGNRVALVYVDIEDTCIYLTYCNADRHIICSQQDIDEAGVMLQEYGRED